MNFEFTPEQQQFRDAVAGFAQKNLKAMLTQSFTKLDLVTREEFDVQAAVLTRTREKLAALELRLAALEKNTPIA